MSKGTRKYYTTKLVIKLRKNVHSNVKQGVAEERAVDSNIKQNTKFVGEKFEKMNRH